MKKILLTVLILSICTFCLLMTACGGDAYSGSDAGDESGTGSNTPSATEVKADQLNAGTLVDILYNKENKNTIVSHTSLNAALGLLGEGASGSTLDSIEEYLGMDMTAFAEKSRATYDSYSELESGQIALANALWLNTASGSKLKPAYESKVKSDFYSEISQRDFSDGRTDEIINDWCSDHTKGLIKDIVDDSITDCTLVGANALYFNCNWIEPFTSSQTSKENFTLFDGSSRKINMMHSTEHTYLENDKATGFMKYYFNGIAFVGILPKSDENFSLSEINPENLISTQTEDYDVDIMLPKFKAEDSNSLIEVLSDMGLSHIFSPGEADFTAMATGDRLYVDSLLQKTYIDVNESGTEAAAVTEFSAKATAIPVEKETKEVFLNRPFAFAIYDGVNDEFLFIGKIIDLR